MIEVKIQENVWADFTSIARKKRRSPDALLQSVLRDYLQLVADEELIEQSRREARQAGF